MTSHPNSTYTPERGDAILLRLSMGESLHMICKDVDQPTMATFYRWMRDNPDLRAAYQEAREAQADFYADQIVEISDREPDPHRAKVQIDARKWRAATLRPRSYGDKLQIDGRVEVERTFTDEERVQAIMLALREANVALPIEVKADE